MLISAVWIILYPNYRIVKCHKVPLSLLLFFEISVVPYFSTICECECFCECAPHAISENSVPCPDALLVTFVTTSALKDCGGFGGGEGLNLWWLIGSSWFSFHDRIP